MRENIKDERAADTRGVDTETTALSRDTKGYTNNYNFEGFKIRETFDPNGPTFSDCIVRVFAV